ncbi:hypothetical protein CEUSTIGMA_g12995.t1 [Chlamydomonas eustigma]|uniref:Thioredoxin domain-containing protein n=1 Tax=Chlamydomonas eustigma TaxID=1157962 RepID=A0A250XS06_9CHLO|nr:hypothetical protein CEUSTIGMA_g12995.t1 [Chlamydomonas eustigma]|eukprot:GAX85580.1 hypothetical protein CEUSTIGMA_g12995.t1 [Chlamydomonas eustigma]
MMLTSHIDHMLHNSKQSSRLNGYARSRSDCSLPRRFDKFSLTSTRASGPDQHEKPNSMVSSSDRSQTLTASSNASEQSTGNSNTSGGGIALGAVMAAVIAFTAGRLVSGEPSLAMLENQAVPLDVALSNGKPTVMEFYANWCEVCKSLVADEVDVEQKYRQDVNFVMLNIDNSKWAPEVAEYGVNGIPHFVFLDEKAMPIAAAVGKLPKEVLEGNIEAMARGKQLPYLRASGETSSSQASNIKPAAPRPRDHS